MKVQKVKLWNRDFIIACVSYFLVACSFNLLMPTIPIFLSEELHIPTSQIGIALSSYAIALLFIRPFSGYLVDVFPRKPLFVFGITFFVILYTGYYFAATVLFFVVLRFIHGLFWGLSTVSANTVAIDIIPASRRAEGIGYYGVNSSIAMAIAPFISVKLYDMLGFDFVITSALVMGFIAIVVVLFIRVPKHFSTGDRPPLSLDRFILIKGVPILFNQLFMSFGWGTLIAFGVLYGLEIGIKNSGIFFLFLAVGIILSRVTSGRLVDRGHIHDIMMAALVLISIGFISFALIHSIYAFCAAAFLIGLGYGTLFPALQTIYINMAPASKRGTANSTYLTGFDIGIGTGMLVGAYIAEASGYSSMFFTTGLLCIIALVIYYFSSRKVYEKNKLS